MIFQRQSDNPLKLTATKSPESHDGYLEESWISDSSFFEVSSGRALSKFCDVGDISLVSSEFKILRDYNTRSYIHGDFNKPIQGSL